MAAVDDVRRLTRSQANRLSTGIDENLAANAGKQAATKQIRARRALQNIGNTNISHAVDASKAVGQDDLKKAPAVVKPAPAAVPAPRAEPPVTRRQSREMVQAEKERPAVSEPSRMRSRARTGLTQNLVNQSERAAHVGLSGRLGKVNLRGDDSVDMYDDAMPSPLPNIDKDDMEDANNCAEYAEDIFSFFRCAEAGCRVNPDYMSQQRTITRQMRAVLVDWLVDVHWKFKMLPETLFLAIYIIDKFLGKQEVDRRNLQLVGIAGLLIASKYEEVYGPAVKEFEFICDGAYTRKAILDMERLMLKSLGFNFTVPTTFTFLTRYVKAAGYAKYNQVLHFAQYLCEWSLISYSCLKWPCSMIAAAAVHVALKVFKQNIEEDGFPRALRKHSGYTLEQVESCAAYLVNLQAKAHVVQFKALYTKFKRNTFHGVARYPAPTEQFAGKNPALPLPGAAPAAPAAR